MATFITRSWLLDQKETNPSVSTGRSLKWGVVATGGISGSVTRDLALLEDAELYAVSSRSQSSAEAFASRHGFAAAYGDAEGQHGYERLVNDPAVDVVYVGTPHAQHFEIARAALNAGKHVLVEKAFTINAREAVELVELARTKNLFLMEAVWSRFLPSINRIWEIVDSGELGEIAWVSADLSFPAPPDPEARIWARNDGGGALLDLTVYPLLWPLGALGFPDAAAAVGSLTEQRVDAQNLISLTYASGAQATLTSSLKAYGPSHAVIAGDKGHLKVSRSINNPAAITVQTGWRLSRTEEFEVVGRGYTYELREVTRCIQQNLVESPTMPWEDSINVMRFFDGVRGQLGITYPNDERP